MAVVVRVFLDGAVVGALHVESRQERLQRGVQLHSDGDALEARVVPDGVDVAHRQTDLLARGEAKLLDSTELN